MDFDIIPSRMTEYDADGFLLTQRDLDGQARVASGESHFPWGVWGRAPDPYVDSSGQVDPAQAPQLLVGMQGGQAHHFPLEDPRTIVKLPLAKPGEAGQYGVSGAFTRIHLDGSHTRMTTDAGGDPSGKSVYDQTAPDGFRWIAPWGTMKFDSTGLHVVHASGAEFHLGGIGGLPPPLDQLGSYCHIQAGMVSAKGGIVSTGASEAGEPAPKGLQLIAYLSQLVAVLQLMQTALTAAAGDGTTKAGVPPAAASLTALQTLATQTAALATTLLSSHAVG